MSVKGKSFQQVITVHIHGAGLDFKRDFRVPATAGFVADVVSSAPPVADNNAAVKRAMTRGAESKVALLTQPGMLNGEQMGKRLGLSRAAVDQRRLSGALLALEVSSRRGLRYPEWQAELLEDPESRRKFESVLRALAPGGAWSAYRFFSQPTPALNGQSPRAAWRHRSIDQLVSLAHSWAEKEQGGG